MGIKRTILAMVGISEDEKESSEPDTQIHETGIGDAFLTGRDMSYHFPQKYITREMLMKIFVTSLRGREDCVSIINSLKDNKPVIVDFSKAEHNEACRCFNYLLGATYALNGSALGITSDIFVFVSEKMEISNI